MKGSIVSAVVGLATRFERASTFTGGRLTTKHDLLRRQCLGYAGVGGSVRRTLASKDGPAHDEDGSSTTRQHDDDELAKATAYLEAYLERFTQPATAEKTTHRHQTKADEKPARDAFQIRRVQSRPGLSPEPAQRAHRHLGTQRLKDERGGHPDLLLLWRTAVRARRMGLEGTEAESNNAGPVRPPSAVQGDASRIFLWVQDALKEQNVWFLEGKHPRVCRGVQAPNAAGHIRTWYTVWWVDEKGVAQEARRPLVIMYPRDCMAEDKDLWDEVTVIREWASTVCSEKLKKNRHPMFDDAPDAIDFIFVPTRFCASVDTPKPNWTFTVKISSLAMLGEEHPYFRTPYILAAQRGDVSLVPSKQTRRDNLSSWKFRAQLLYALLREVESPQQQEKNRLPSPTEPQTPEGLAKSLEKTLWKLTEESGDGLDIASRLIEGRTQNGKVANQDCDEVNEAQRNEAGQTQIRNRVASRHGQG